MLAVKLVPGLKNYKSKIFIKKVITPSKNNQKYYKIMILRKNLRKSLPKVIF